MKNNISQPKPDNVAAKKFLKKWNASGPWVLTAINPQGKGINTQSFDATNEANMDKWLEKYNGYWNLYFNVNPVIRNLTSKAKREDIRSVDWLHVDIDPEAGKELDKERDRCLDLLTDKLPQGIPKPTVIIFSGGGYQGFWKLKEPIVINGNLELAEDAKRYNQQLEKLFGADNCHNIDRIMRLPGTINIPDARKLKKGRSKALATVLDFNPTCIYYIGQFKKCESNTRSSSTIAQGRNFKHILDIPDNVQPISNIEEALAQYGLPENVARICKYGKDPENPIRDGDNSRSGWLFSTVCRMVMFGVPDETIYAIITDKKFLISESILEQESNAGKHAIRQIEKAHEFLEKEGKIVLKDDSPYRSCKEYARRYRPNILHNNGDWLDYNGASYEDIETDTIKSELYNFLDKQLTIVRDKTVPFNPNKSKVEKVIDALKAYVHKQKGSFSPPCFLNDNELNPKEILACQNGLLHLPTRTLYPATPDFFTRNALGFNYTLDAPPPEKWLNFLKGIWPDDKQSIQALQEMFGYLLIPDTSLQKIFLMVGPKRSGKGTIARITTQLLGQDNVCSPTLNSMCGDFGLQALIGKQLAIISDMRIGRNTDKAAVSENLLRISGEDAVTANRKYKTEWNGTLVTRFLIMTNEIPRLDDVSGALASRFVPLIMTKSFYGKENPNLANELGEELPAILNWAIEGWQRLHDRGRFVLPNSAMDALQELSDIASPISAFVRDECEIIPSAITPKEELYRAYIRWNERNGYHYNSNMAVFGRDLNSVLQGEIKSTKPRSNKTRVPSYAGIKLKGNQQEQEEDNIPF